MPGRHLHRREQRVEAAEALAEDRHADHRQVGVGGGDAGQRRRHPGPGDDHLQPAHPRVRGSTRAPARGRGGRSSPAPRSGCRRPAAPSPAGCIFGLSFFEPMMIPTSGSSTSISSKASSTAGIVAGSAAGGSVGCGRLGVSEISLISSSLVWLAGHALDGAGGDVGADLHSVEGDPARPHRMRDRAPRPGVGPRPVTLSTRPPAVTISPSRSAVPAWVTSASSAASSRPRDHVALRGGLRVAGRGEDDGHRPVVAELGLGAGQAARLARGEAEVDQVGAQPRQHRLRLGVAEAGVELEHLRARRRRSSGPA